MKEAAAVNKQNPEQHGLIPFLSNGSALKAKLSPPVPWIALLGVDGSGKSSVLGLLEQEIVTTPFTGLVVIHRRPKIAYPETNVQPGVVAHYNKPPHGPLKSILKLLAIVLDWQIGYWRDIATQRAQKRLVVCDRHALLDLLVDPARYRYNGPSWLVKLALSLAPKPDAVLLLDAPTEVLQRRKEELTATETVVLRDAYLRLVRKLGNGYVIDASKPLEQVVEQVRERVLEVSWFETRQTEGSNVSFKE